MVALAMTGLLVGFLLGLRFRVMVLLPIELAAFAAATSVAAITDVGFLSAALAFAIFAVSSQISYGIALTLPLWRPQRLI